MLYDYKSLIDECIMVGYIYNHGGIMKTGELLINPTSLIAPTLHGYRQAIVRLLSLHRGRPLSQAIDVSHC